MTLTDAARARYVALAQDTWSDDGEYDLNAVVAAIVTAPDADRTAALAAIVRGWKADADQLHLQLSAKAKADEKGFFDASYLAVVGARIRAFQDVLAVLDGGGDDDRE